MHVAYRRLFVRTKRREKKDYTGGCSLFRPANALSSSVSRNLTEVTCQVPVRDESRKFVVMILIVVLIAGGMVCTRLLYKQFVSLRRHLDSADWTILAAMVISLPTVAVTIFGLVAHGMGKDLWGVSPGDLVAFGLSFYVIQVLYVLLMGVVKISLTLFYLSIFAGVGIRRLFWATVGFHALFTLGFTVGIIFQCVPVSYQTAKYDLTNLPLQPVYARCLDINASGWANAALTLASDIWLLGLPLSQIHHLHLHWKKKIGVAFMFLTGVG